MSRILLSLTFLICFTKCNSKSEYPYFQTFKDYLRNEFQIQDSLIDGTYYLLPVNGCSSCVRDNIQMLKEVDNIKINLILIGNTTDVEFKNEVEILSIKFSPLLDIEDNARFYELGLAKPLLIIIEDGQPIYYEQIADFKILEAQKLIEEQAL